MNSLRHKNTRCERVVRSPLNKNFPDDLATVSQTLPRPPNTTGATPARPPAVRHGYAISLSWSLHHVVHAPEPRRSSRQRGTRRPALVVRARPACREAGRRDRRDSTVASVVSPLQAMPSGIRGRGSDTSKTSHHRRQSAYMNMCFRCCSGALLVCWPDPSRDEVKSSQVTLDLKIDLT